MIYSQQLDFWQGASEQIEGVYIQYMTDDERACNAAENSSAKSINILITARDMGAAINIVEIVNFAQTQKNCKLHLYIQNPASNYFTTSQISHSQVPHVISKKPDDEHANFLIDYANELLNKIKPNIILCGLSTPGDGGIDEALIKVAKNKIPTVVMQDFWGEVNDFFGSCADFYFCLDEEAKVLTEKKYPARGIVIGSPRHSWYKNLNIKAMRTKLRKELNLSNHQKVVGLFGQSLHHIAGYQQIIAEFLQLLPDIQPQTAILYRPHPRENQQQAQNTIALLKESNCRFFIADNRKVEYSLLMCDVVCSILSNCLYDASYLNYYSDMPLLTPIALCYKLDIRQHLQNFNMIEGSPYKAKEIAIICDMQKPDALTMEYLLAAESRQACWLASKKLFNPEHAAEKALHNLVGLTESLLMN